MSFVFLLVRLLVGGYLAWEGTRRLSAYGRHAVVDETRASEFMVVLQGLLALAGGALIATGIAVPAGVAFAVIFLGITSLGLRGLSLLTRVSLAVATTLLLVIPRPWPFMFVE